MLGQAARGHPKLSKQQHQPHQPPVPPLTRPAEVPLWLPFFNNTALVAEVLGALCPLQHGLEARAAATLCCDTNNTSLALASALGAGCFDCGDTCVYNPASPLLAPDRLADGLPVDAVLAWHWDEEAECWEEDWGELCNATSAGAAQAAYVSESYAMQVREWGGVGGGWGFTGLQVRKRPQPITHMRYQQACMNNTVNGTCCAQATLLDFLNTSSMASTFDDLLHQHQVCGNLQGCTACHSVMSSLCWALQCRARVQCCIVGRPATNKQQPGFVHGPTWQHVLHSMCVLHVRHCTPSPVHTSHCRNREVLLCKPAWQESF